MDSDHPALAYSLTDLALALERRDREAAARQIKRQLEAYRKLREKGAQASLAERAEVAARLAEEAVSVFEVRQAGRAEVSSLKERALAIVEDNVSEAELRVLRRELLKKQVNCLSSCMILFVPNPFVSQFLFSQIFFFAAHDQ